MARRIVLLRHAESANNVLYVTTRQREGRSPDPLLSGQGREQADLLAAELARDDSLRDVTVWASPTMRAVATAAAVVRAGTGREILLVPDLVEGGGTYERVDDVRQPRPGSSLEQLQDAAGDVPVRWVSPEAAQWDGGFEDYDDIPGRAARVVQAWREHPDETLLCVAHGWFDNHLIRAALGLPTGNDEIRSGWFRIPNASITELDLADGGAATLKRLGDTHHLAGKVLDDAPELDVVL